MAQSLGTMEWLKMAAAQGGPFQGMSLLDGQNWHKSTPQHTYPTAHDDEVTAPQFAPTNAVKHHAVIAARRIACHDDICLENCEGAHPCDVPVEQCAQPACADDDCPAALKTHDERGEFECEVCGRDFRRRDGLRRHMKTHQKGGERKKRSSLSESKSSS